MFVGKGREEKKIRDFTRVKLEEKIGRLGLFVSGAKTSSVLPLALLHTSLFIGVQNGFVIITF